MQGPSCATATGVRPSPPYEAVHACATSLTYLGTLPDLSGPKALCFTFTLGQYPGQCSWFRNAGDSNPLIPKIVSPVLSGWLRLRAVIVTSNLSGSRQAASPVTYWVFVSVRRPRYTLVYLPGTRGRCELRRCPATLCHLFSVGTGRGPSCPFLAEFLPSEYDGDPLGEPTAHTSSHKEATKSGQHIHDDLLHLSIDPPSTVVRSGPDRLLVPSIGDVKVLTRQSASRYLGRAHSPSLATGQRAGCLQKASCPPRENADRSVVTSRYSVALSHRVRMQCPLVSHTPTVSLVLSKSLFS
jgi:hypothetical protein